LDQSFRWPYKPELSPAVAGKVTTSAPIPVGTGM
jgi:hypothetical protein